MRGEDSPRLVFRRRTSGSPPHARGRLRHPRFRHVRRGITPACAGKTPPGTSERSSTRDHPRMRGEDGRMASSMMYLSGSPPHARGRPHHAVEGGIDQRITPACAGKTGSSAGPWPKVRDHPRMRGEDWLVRWALAESSGSPPHARGRRASEVSLKGLEGITPACAGKTPSTGGATRTTTDHPRMRGEDPGLRRGEDLEPGSPPHARGRP